MRKTAFFTAVVIFLLIFIVNSRGQDNWQKISSFPSDYVINDISFVTQKRGWAVGFKHISGIGPAGVILATENGGITWIEKVVDSSYSWFNKFYLSKENHHWAVGFNVHYKTLDGQNWVSVPDSVFDIQQYWGLSDMYSVCFYGSSYGIIGGVAGFCSQTRDGDTTWVSEDLAESGVFVDTLQSIKMLSPDVIIIACTGGIVRSEDGGETWNKVYSDFKNYYRVYFVNDSTGWALSTEGKILFTSDRGKSWQEFGNVFDDYSMATDMAFINENVGWICTNSGKILKTVDGGHTWNKSQIDNTLLKSLSIVPVDKIGFIVDGNCDLYSASLDVSGLEDKNMIIPKETELCQCYPNPFNPVTNIPYKINAPSFVSLKIYDVYGREVKKVVGDFQSPGSYNARFDAGNLPSGLYFYKIRVGNDFIETKKMILMR